MTFNTMENSTNISVFPEYSGYIAATISCIFFGSNLIPVKHFELNDGVFFQWIAANGVLAVAIIVHIIRGLPRVYFLPMLGGVMWATGNLFIVAIIKTIGLSFGMLIWSSVNMLSGWASGRFGWFSLTPQIPLHPTLNYIGVAFAASRGPILLFVKQHRNLDLSKNNVTSDAKNRLSEDVEARTALDIEGDRNTSNEEPERERGFWDRFSPLQKKLIGCSLSVFAGLMFGFNFVPVTYCIDHYEGISNVGLDHVLAQCCGIYLTSTFFFLVYAMVLKNHPRGIAMEAIVPGLTSGGMWSVANAGWMLANTTISQSISFPLITTAPSVVACLWAIFLYHEIKGLRNYFLVGTAFLLTIIGAVLCGLSRPGEYIKA